MNNPLSSQRLSETRKTLLRALTSVGTHLSSGEKPRGGSNTIYSLSIEDALWAFEWRNPTFSAEFRELLDTIPMRDGTFTFQYAFVCQTIVGWSGKSPSGGDKRFDDLLADTMRLIKQHAHAAGEFRTLLLEYRQVDYVRLCRIVINQRAVIGNR